ncbi:penicillin-binding protein 2 [Desulfohalobium retbaense]|uniref:Penicillin-binding protein 2 n=1 Tax=Desulfohalobium retbaense (strain ATCC 49708 / DSM 5692 / JCM 16813 / HR100) TaxID=485915 RepID=C8X506_DESRD|nr:penicillin-binding protein 2 [Desulfohalobium retbaense]ACV69503.1 penicillin-binding protein 2 [Desulfohalobium retbaense DSM 5692]
MLDAELFQPSKKGLVLVRLCILGLFCVFALRLWYLQIHKGETFASKARENRLREIPVYAPRGLIRDRHGTLVAENTPAYALALIREESPDIAACLQQVSRWTGHPLSELRSRFERGRKRTRPFESQVLIPHLDFELVARIEAHAPEWPGLKVLSRPQRYYPYGRDLAHVLGYVAQASEEELRSDSMLRLGDTVGKQGIEKVLEQRLRGDKGRKQVEVDAVGRGLQERVLRQPKAGNDVRLSIDLSLQRLAMDLLTDKAGVIIVLEPETGQVLTLASSPSYDSNLFVEGISPKDWKRLLHHPRNPLQNRAIQSAYPPGSVFKLVMAGCALHEMGVDPEREVYCNGAYRLGNRSFRCWKKWGHGDVDLQKALVQSCDVYFYKLGQELGVDTISPYAKAWGLGSKTGIGLPHERNGLIPSRAWKRHQLGAGWQGGETLNMSIGQGFTLTTPLQIARVVGALVNKGQLVKPTLLQDAAVEIEGEVPLDPPERQRIVEYMVDTVESRRGTARVLRTEDVVIGGKTGTAQVVKLRDDEEEEEETPYKYRDHAWMASFGRRGEDQYVVVTFIEHGGHGGAAAGPPTKAIYEALFPQLGKGDETDDAG